MAVLLSHIKQ